MHLLHFWFDHVATRNSEYKDRHRTLFLTSPKYSVHAGEAAFAYQSKAH